MHELANNLEFWSLVKLRLDPVLDRLDVVVGDLLDLLDRQRIGAGKVLVQVCQVFNRTRRELGEFLEAGLAERDEPCHFHLHPTVHQAELAANRREVFHLGRIAAVKRGNGVNCRGCYSQLSCRFFRRGGFFGEGSCRHCCLLENKNTSQSLAREQSLS